jgi:hypothetical protein
MSFILRTQQTAMICSSWSDASKWKAFTKFCGFSLLPSSGSDVTGEEELTWWLSEDINGIQPAWKLYILFNSVNSAYVEFDRKDNKFNMLRVAMKHRVLLLGKDILYPAFRTKCWGRFLYHEESVGNYMIWSCWFLFASRFGPAICF